jgi:hypothetical protein
MTMMGEVRAAMRMRARLSDEAGVMDAPRVLFSCCCVHSAQAIFDRGKGQAGKQSNITSACMLPFFSTLELQTSIPTYVHSHLDFRTRTCQSRA